MALTTIQKIDRLGVDGDLLHGVVHGPAKGPGSVVTTEGGPVITVAAAIANVQDYGDAAIVQVEKQSNASILQMQVLANAQGYQVPVDYAAGITLTQPNQTVEYGGETYAPVVSALPFVTSGTFEDDKFRLIQGVSASDLGSAGGASLVGFQQAGPGSILRTVESKFQEFISLADKGAIGDGGTTDNGPAILAAITEANGRPILVPMDAAGGQFAVTSGVVVVPAGTRLLYEGEAKIYAVGDASITDASNSVNHLSSYGGMRQYLRGDFTGSSTGGHNYNYAYIAGDRIKAATKVDGYCMELHFGGATAQGGRHAIEAFAIQDAVTSSANPDRNYVGIAGSCITSTGDGGTADDPVGKGQYFGSNFVGYHKGGRFITNVTACEFNTITTASGGNEIYIHTGIQIGSRIGVRGIAVDAQINCTGGAAGLRWRNGLMFSSANGAYSLGSDSTVISAGSQDGTVLRGIKLVPCNEYILDSGDVRLTNKSLQLGAPGASIEVGSSTAAGSSFIDLHSGGFPVDYDVRMISSGGSATNGMGNLQLLAGSSITLSSATTVFTGALRPSTDGTVDLGVASYRLGTIFAKNGAINTSDQRAKDGVTQLSDVQNSINGISVEQVFEAWADVRYAVFRFIDSVEVKGNDARWHVGVVAQQVVAAFSARGLDATTFGFLCHDVWDDEYEEWGDEYQDVPAVVSDLVDRLGDPIITQPAQRILSRAAGKRLIRAAGDLYGIRYEESHSMEVAYLRWRLEKSDSRCDEMEARIAALEGGGLNRQTLPN